MAEPLRIPNKSAPGPFYTVVYDENLNLVQANSSARTWHNIGAEDVISGRYHYDDFSHLYKPCPESCREMLLDALNGTVTHASDYVYGDVWFSEYGPVERYNCAYILCANIGQVAKTMRAVRQVEGVIEPFPH